MATLSKLPKKKACGKGEPPAETNVVAMTRNLSRTEAGATRDLNFKVPAEFHREFKSFAVGQGMTMRQVLEEAFELMKERYGS